jgi:DNA-binding transcriptional regulator YiaG
MNNLDRIIEKMDPARRKRIAARAAELVAQEQSLQQLRLGRKLTQESIADTLGIGQDNVSRLEQRNDLLVSTVRSYVEAMGGKLSLVAEFPNQEPVVLSGIAGPKADKAKRASKRKAAPARRTPRAARSGDR